MPDPTQALGLGTVNKADNVSAPMTLNSSEKERITENISNKAHNML